MFGYHSPSALSLTTSEGTYIRFTSAATLLIVHQLFALGTLNIALSLTTSLRLFALGFNTQYRDFILFRIVGSYGAFGGLSRSNEGPNDFPETFRWLEPLKEKVLKRG